MDGFSQIVGAQHCLTAPGDIAPYGEDWRGTLCQPPDLVLRPADTGQVRAILARAAALGLDVVPAGGRTGLAGGSVPVSRNARIVSVSLERMNRIRHVDPVDMSITVEAGCVIEAVQNAAAAADRLFPLSFGAQGSAQVGGAISTNAGGIRALRYGTMRDLVLGLEVVLPDGRLLNDMRAVRKDNTGYALRHLFIGAEGTLGAGDGGDAEALPADAGTADCLRGGGEPGGGAGPAGPDARLRRRSRRLRALWSPPDRAHDPAHPRVSRTGAADHALVLHHRDRRRPPGRGPARDHRGQPGRGTRSR